MDMNKVSLIIGTSALILAVPLSIVGNLLTPKLRDWYSATSEKKLQARIAALMRQLRQSEQEWTFTTVEWIQYRTNARAIQTFFWLFGCIFMSVILTIEILTLELTDYITKLGKNAPFSNHGLIATAVVISIGPFVGNLLVGAFLNPQKANYQENRLMHSNEGREELRRQIAHLSTKLAKNSIRGASVSS